MDSKDKQQVTKNKHFYQSFIHAMDGLITIFMSERNFRFHCLATLVVIGGGFYFRLNNEEWISLLMVIILVLISEIINTIIERVVDLIVGKHYHPIAKEVKDMAAGLVILSALFAIIVGLIVFLPHLVVIFRG